MPKAKNLKIIMTITSLHDGERAVPPAELEKAGLTYEGFSPTPTTWDPSAEVPVCGRCHDSCAGSLSAHAHRRTDCANTYLALLTGTCCLFLVVLGALRMTR